MQAWWERSGLYWPFEEESLCKKNPVWVSSIKFHPWGLFWLWHSDVCSSCAGAEAPDAMVIETLLEKENFSCGPPISISPLNNS